MKILALDTSMAACSAAVHDTAAGSTLSHRWLAMDRGHAEAIAPMVNNVVTEARLRFADLNRIAVTVGPGTFTGVRIGLAMGRGLGLALGVPVVASTSLSAVAANEGSMHGPLLVAADARMGEVYAALFEDGKVVRQPAAVTTAGLDIPQGARISGTAADAVIAALGRNDLLRTRSGDLPMAANFARLAGSGISPSAMPTPIYLRQPDAKPQAVAARIAAVSIREATPFELPLLAILHAECFDHPWTEHDFAGLLAMPGTAALVAVEQPQRTGSGICFHGGIGLEAGASSPLRFWLHASRSQRAASRAPARSSG